MASNTVEVKQSDTLESDTVSGLNREDINIGIRISYIFFFFWGGGGGGFFFT